MRGLIHLHPSKTLIIRISGPQLREHFPLLPDAMEGCGCLGMPDDFSRALSLLRRPLELRPLDILREMLDKTLQFPAEIEPLPRDLIHACSAAPKRLIVSVRPKQEPIPLSVLDTLFSPPTFKQRPRLHIGRHRIKNYRYERAGDRWLFHGNMEDDEHRVHIIMGSEKTDTSWAGNGTDESGKPTLAAVLGVRKPRRLLERFREQYGIERFHELPTAKILQALRQAREDR